MPLFGSAVLEHESSAHCKAWKSFFFFLPLFIFLCLSTFFVSFKLLQYIIVNSEERYSLNATLIVRLSQASQPFSHFLHTFPPLSNMITFSCPHSLHASSPCAFSYNTVHSVNDNNYGHVLYHYCTLSHSPQSTLQELK